jgi:thiamine biosynthesis lipoprotein
MKRTFLLVILAALLLSGCTRSRTFQKTEPIMGTDVTITVVAQDEREAHAAIEAGMDEVKRLDQMMSLYRDDSEVTKVNKAAGKQPVRVSPEMIEVVQAARRVSELTHGAFDVTIGPLVVLWQMRLKEGRVPSDAEIARVKALVDYRDIVVDERASTLFLKKRGMIMDLGGMKGFIADRVRNLFRQRGIGNAVIALAGDIWVLGHRDDGSSWRIGVQHPREHDRTLTVLDLTDRYISTSGDYERFVIREKKRYHHIIDPRTGKPSQGVISSTVVGTDGALIDPLAKAPFILGVTEGMKIVEQQGAEAIVVDDAGTVFTTKGIRILEEQPAPAAIK